MRRGEIRWATLGRPRGSGPGYRRPVLVVQSDEFNESRISTVVVAALTSNTRLAMAPGNVFLESSTSGLQRDSVINVSQLLTLDRKLAGSVIGRLSPRRMAEVNEGIRMVLGL